MNIVTSSIYTQRLSNGTFDYELKLISSYGTRMSLEKTLRLLSYLHLVFLQLCVV